MRTAKQIIFLFLFSLLCGCVHCWFWDHIVVMSITVVATFTLCLLKWRYLVLWHWKPYRFVCSFVSTPPNCMWYVCRVMAVRCNSRKSISLQIISFSLSTPTPYPALLSLSLQLLTLGPPVQKEQRLHYNSRFLYISWHRVFRRSYTMCRSVEQIQALRTCSSIIIGSILYLCSSAILDLIQQLFVSPGLA